MGFDQSSVLRDKLDRRLASRQAKKSEKFALPVVVAREKSREELRQERDRKYLEENFPDGDFYFDKIVRVEDL